MLDKKDATLGHCKEILKLAPDDWAALTAALDLTMPATAGAGEPNIRDLESAMARSKLNKSSGGGGDVPTSQNTTAVGGAGGGASCATTWLEKNTTTTTIPVFCMFDYV